MLLHRGGKIAPTRDIELQAVTVRRILPTARAILSSVGPISGHAGGALARGGGIL
jgi:hypothetical protein